MNAMGPKHRLVVPIPVYKQLRAYIMSVPFEISGLGAVEVVKLPGGNVDFYVRDVYLVSQESSDAYTILDPKGIAVLMAAKEMLPIKLWWHSHGNFDVFWSPKDEQTISALGRTWMVSIVGNRKENFLARLDVYDPFRYSADIRIAFDIPYDPVDDISVLEEVAEKVRYVPPKKEEAVGGSYDWQDW